MNSWLKQNDFFKAPPKKTNPSHLLYDGSGGGKIYVPNSRLAEFSKIYAAELDKKTKLYFVECRPKIYKFMVDIDISDDHYWSEFEIQKIIKIIQKVVNDFYLKEYVTICATSPIKMKNNETHTGVHLIWPHLYVCSETSLFLRQGIVQRLSESDISLKKSWEDVIDEVIYTRNGFRMIGSDKMTFKKPENRELVVKFIMNSDGDVLPEYLSRLENNTVMLVEETSIRIVPDGKKSNDIKKIPTWLKEDAIKIAEKRHNKNFDQVIRVADNKTHIIIENFIRANLPRPYLKDKIKAITKYEDGNLLIKTESRYCLNLKREHNSCGIYFFATPVGIYQKCLCPCMKLDGREFGYCKDFTSECFKFTKEITDSLFPEIGRALFLENKKKLNYKPGTTTQSYIEKEKTAICDKLLNDILTDF